MKKKVVSILLSLIMTSALAAGAVTVQADELRADEGKVISVAHGQGEYIYESFYEIGNKFTEMTGIEIEWIEIASSDYNTWVTAQFAAGTEPDILWGAPKDYFDQGKLADITEYYSQENPFNGKKWTECFAENALDNTYSIDGTHQICTAMSSVTTSLYYNKDIMEELGLGTEPPATFSEMIEMMKVCKEDGRYVPMSVMNSSGWNLKWLEELFMDSLFNGTDVVERLDIIVPNGTLDEAEVMLGLKTGVIDYEDPRIIEYYSLMKDLTQYFNEDFNSASWEYEGLFNDGKVLFNINGGWYPGQVVENGYDIHYGTAQKPYIDSEYSEYGMAEAFKMEAISGEAVFYVSQKCADEGELSAAVKFLQFMTCPEGGAQMYVDAVMLGSCILGIEYPEEVAGLGKIEYGDDKTTGLKKTFNFAAEPGSKYWEMYTEYMDPASSKSAEDFAAEVKEEMLWYLDDAIEEYTAYDILSYVDQVQ